MNKKNSSSWSEIKTLDERLAKDPGSFCFARLSETYLKVGLVADALHTARQGVAKHPGYLAGQRALAMACNANGLHDEARRILEQVTAAMPEDTAAQKLLASLYVDAGDTASAIRAYTTLLDFRPDDVPSKARLEELQQFAAVGPAQTDVRSFEPTAGAGKIDEVAEEDVYELSEDDVIHDEDVVEVEPAAAAVEISAPVHHDPLSTLTLAELYEQQGFVAKALDIYRTILADDPANAQLKTKILQLEEREAGVESLPEQPEPPETAVELEADFEQETVFESEEFAPVAVEEGASLTEQPTFLTPTVFEENAIAEPESVVSAVLEEVPAPVEAQDFSPLVHKQADHVTGTLDNWLENIRRIKACR